MRSKSTKNLHKHIKMVLNHNHLRIMHKHIKLIDLLSTNYQIYICIIYVVYNFKINFELFWLGKN